MVQHNTNMKKIKLTIACLLLGGVAFAQTQCTSLTKSNVQCKNTVKNGELCYSHNPNYVKPSETTTVICSGTTKSNAPCKNKTKNAGGLCHLHKQD